MKISSTTANVVHILSVLLQVLNLVSGIVPPKYQPYVGAAIAAGQYYMGHLQHNSVPPSAQ